MQRYTDIYIYRYIYHIDRWIDSQIDSQLARQIDRFIELQKIHLLFFIQQYFSIKFFLQILLNKKCFFQFLIDFSGKRFHPLHVKKLFYSKNWLTFHERHNFGITCYIINYKFFNVNKVTQHVNYTCLFFWKCSFGYYQYIQRIRVD